MGCSTFNFYARISAVNTQEPVSGTTCLLEAQPNTDLAKRIKDYSRMTYGTGLFAETPDQTPVENSSPVAKIKHKKVSKRKSKLVQVSE